MTTSEFIFEFVLVSPSATMPPPRQRRPWHQTARIPTNDVSPTPTFKFSSQTPPVQQPPAVASMDAAAPAEPCSPAPFSFTPLTGLTPSAGFGSVGSLFAAHVLSSDLAPFTLKPDSTANVIPTQWRVDGPYGSEVPCWLRACLFG